MWDSKTSDILWTFYVNFSLHDVEDWVAIEVSGALLGEDHQAGEPRPGLVLALSDIVLFM